MKGIENANEEEWSERPSLSNVKQNNVIMTSSVVGPSNCIVSFQSLPQLTPYSPSTWCTVPSLPLHPSPHPSPGIRHQSYPQGTTAPFVLCFIQRNISTCYSCKQKYLKPLVPPYDLCVRHEEWRTFTVASFSPQSCYGNAYYHVNVACIQCHWPMFQPTALVITPEVGIQLHLLHKQLLSHFGLTMP